MGFFKEIGRHRWPFRWLNWWYEGGCTWRQVRFPILGRYLTFSVEMRRKRGPLT